MINSPISTLTWLRMFTCYISVQWDIIKILLEYSWEDFAFMVKRLKYLLPSLSYPFCPEGRCTVLILTAIFVAKEPTKELPPWHHGTESISIYLSLKTFYYLRKNKSIFIQLTACNVGLCEVGSIPSSESSFLTEKTSSIFQAMPLFLPLFMKTPMAWIWGLTLGGYERIGMGLKTNF